MGAVFRILTMFVNVHVMHHCGGDYQLLTVCVC